jgi:carboxyl-terminal processing protease
MKTASKLKSIIPGFLLGLFCMAAIAWDDYFEISKNLEIHSILYKELNTYYVDELNPGELMKTGIDAMLKSLDPYTNYYPESIVEDARFENTGTYGGIGATFKVIEGAVVISETYENSPAQKSGILPGDIINEVSGKKTEGRNIAEVLNLVKGSPGSKVSMKLIRDGVAQNVEVQREEIKVKDVPYSDIVAPEIGYIKLVGFTAEASKEVKEALTRLKETSRLKGLILDLRGNPGGLLREAVNISNLFIEKGKTVVTTKGKKPEWNKTYSTLNPPTDLETPIVVLIDRRSASAAEIVSGTLQDYDRGIVIGNKSYGKGLVQITRPLKYNAQLKVTTSKYYTSSGRCIQAIEYSGKNKGEKIPENLQKEFKTAAGRKVYDGGGVMPDIEIADKRLHAITLALIRNNLVFKFANRYKKENPTIAEPENYVLTDQVYEQFVAFVMESGLRYETKTEKALNALKATAEKEKQTLLLEPEIQAIRQKIEKTKEGELRNYKSEITELLIQEIVQRYYFEKGKIKASMRFDADVAKAVEILNNPTLYKQVLSPSWIIPRYEQDTEGAEYENEIMKEVREDME